MRLSLRNVALALCAWAALAAPALAGSQSLMGLGPAPFAGGGGGPVPVWNWATSDFINTGSTSATTSKSSNTITAGDLLIILTGQKPNSVSSYGLTCPATFTALSWAPNVDGTEGWNFIGCWKIAGGAETGAYVVTWTTSSANLSTWALIDITGANASPIDATAITNNAFNGTAAVIVAPTVTSTGTNRLHLSCGATDGSSNNLYSGPPAGYTPTLDASFLSVVKLACATKTISTAVATGTTTWTATLAGSGPGFSILVKP